MITIFSIPKPFDSEFAIIQRNAIQSWCVLAPDVEVILFGNEDGTAEIAYEFGIRHAPEVVCNEYGTPLLSDLFAKAQRLSRHPILCYVNADIILTSGLIAALQYVAHKPSFLMIGRRWDVNIQELWDFSKQGWENHLVEYVVTNGKMHLPTAIDYFVFPHGFYKEIPPFAIGRYAWDQWLVYYARAIRAPVYDASALAMAVHQNHSYMPSQARTSPEAAKNLELASASMGGEFHPFTLHDATWIIDHRGVYPAIGPSYLWRRLMAALFLSPVLNPAFKLSKRLRQWFVHLWASLESSA